MSKKQTSQSVEIKKQESFLSDLPEQSESSSQLSLPTDIQEECQLCGGSGTVEDGDERIVCPGCGLQPLDGQATALACATAGATATGGPICQPTPSSNSGHFNASNVAEESCPNCKGKRYFTEKVMSDEGKTIDATIACGRCNGLGYILIPLYSPVLARERSLASEWPTEPIELDWPWVGEPDQAVGTIVGWNWQTKEVAVITKQPQYFNMKPWKVTIEVQPMPKNLFSCIVICVNEPIVHKDVIWYSDWTRTGVKQLSSTETVTSFSGKCIVQELT